MRKQTKLPLVLAHTLSIHREGHEQRIYQVFMNTTLPDLL